MDVLDLVRPPPRPPRTATGLQPQFSKQCRCPLSVGYCAYSQLASRLLIVDPAGSRRQRSISSILYLRTGRHHNMSTIVRELMMAAPIAHTAAVNVPLGDTFADHDRLIATSACHAEQKFQSRLPRPHSASRRIHNIILRTGLGNTICIAVECTEYRIMGASSKEEVYICFCTCA
jgi:hypothetical protein